MRHMVKTLYSLAGVFFTLTCFSQEINPREFPSAAPNIVDKPVLEIVVFVEDKIHVGKADDGPRAIVPISGGYFTGDRISGKVIPGGADWQVDRLDGVKNIEAIYALKTDDDQTIVVNNLGIVHALTGERYGVTRPVFHAPSGKHEWLNHSFFVGTITSLRKTHGAVIIRVYKVVN